MSIYFIIKNYHIEEHRKNFTVSKTDLIILSLQVRSSPAPSQGGCPGRSVTQGIVPALSWPFLSPHLLPYSSLDSGPLPSSPPTPFAQVGLSLCHPNGGFFSRLRLDSALSMF